MDTGLLLQYALVAVAVLLSAWVVMKRQFPNVTRSLRAGCALPLLRAGHPGWVRAIGCWIAPVASRRRAGADCGGCDDCGPDPRRPE